jgi:hypothetical protein
MKKFKLLALLVALLAVDAVEAAQFNVYSFFNPNVTSVVISNNVGITNLNYISQNLLQGLYQLGTNTAGTGINAPIATNYAALSGTMYTSSVPVQWFGQVYPGTFTVLTNNTVASTANTNDVAFVTVTTNNQFNFFQDVPLPQDQYNGLVTDSGQPGAAGQTNSIGYIQFVTQPFSLTGSGAVGNGSNIVTAIFSPIAVMQQPNPNGAPSTVNGGGAIPGLTPALEPTDLAQPNGVAPYLVVSFTNQISVTLNAPTVATFAVPRWKFPGARGIRLRALYSGTSTNAVCVNSITYQNWVP